MEFLNVFPAKAWLRHRYETRLTLFPQREAKDSQRQRKSETEGITVTCAGTEPNHNSAPCQARRRCCPYPCVRDIGSICVSPLLKSSKTSFDVWNILT